MNLETFKKKMINAMKEETKQTKVQKLNVLHKETLCIR